MKKTMMVLGLIVAVLSFGAVPALAVVPTIDGILSAGEWDAYIALATDPNEAGITDNYDFSSMRVLFDTDGGADDGVYVLLTTYAAPTLAKLDSGNPFPAFVNFQIDGNNDGDFLDASDFSAVHTLAGLTVTDGTGSLLLTGVDGTNFKLGSVLEYFIPGSVLNTFPIGLFNAFARYDNAGNDPDDRIPDSGFTTRIPEPSTIFLLGSGLLGLMGFRFRK